MPLSCALHDSVAILRKQSVRELIGAAHAGPSRVRVISKRIQHAQLSFHIHAVNPYSFKRKISDGPEPLPLMPSEKTAVPSSAFTLICRLIKRSHQGCVGNAIEARPQMRDGVHSSTLSYRFVQATRNIRISPLIFGVAQRC